MTENSIWGFSDFDAILKIFIMFYQIFIPAFSLTDKKNAENFFYNLFILGRRLSKECSTMTSSEKVLYCLSISSN